MCVNKFYDMVQYREQKAGFPLPKFKLGRFLSPCRNNGNRMTMNIMTSNSSNVPRWTVIPLTMAKMNTLDAKGQRVIIDNIIRENHGNLMNLLPWAVEADKKMKAVDCSFIPYEDGEEEPCLIPENDDIDMNISLVDAFVNAKVLLPQGEESEEYEGSNLVQVKVIYHFCDEDGNIMGNANI